MITTNKTTLYFILFCVNLLAAFCFCGIQKSVNSESEDLLSYADTIGLEVQRNLEKELFESARVVDSMAQVLSDSLSSRPQAFVDSVESANIIPDLVKLINALPHIDGAYIGFEKLKTNSSSQRLYSHYTRRVDGALKTDQIEKYYNYTDTAISTAQWFTKPVNADSAVWTGPFLGRTGKRRFLAYGVPVRLSDSLQFVVGVNYTTAKLYMLLNNWKTARIGYPYLMNSEGYFLAHPSDECRTLDTLGLELKNPMLRKLATEIATKGSVDPYEFYHQNTISKKMCWEKIFPMTNFGWHLGISVTDQQVYRNPDFFNQQRSKHILHSLLFFSLLLAAELLFLWKYLNPGLYAFKAGIFTSCLIFLGLLLFTYYYSLRYPIFEFSDMNIEKFAEQTETGTRQKTKAKLFSDDYKVWNFSMLMDTDRVNEYVSLYDCYVKDKGNEPLVQVPTGMYVQTIRFLDSYSAKLTGYIWQLYPLNTKINKGISFPDAENYSLDALDSLQVFLANGDTAKLHRWYFDIEIREPFNYEYYPFDRSDLWIRLWSADFDKSNILLVPDISSYILYNPSYLPGIDNDVVIPGWKMEASYFSYKEKNYFSNFGSNRSLAKSTYPELHFNIMLKRDFLDPIISRIIPLLVLLLMAYSILYLSKKEDALNVAIACSGLLLVAVFEHINLRKSIDMPGIIYLENFYFITYLLLMLVAVNANIEKGFETGSKIKVLCEHCILHLYWFIALLSMLIITLFTFY